MSKHNQTGRFAPRFTLLAVAAAGLLVAACSAGRRPGGGGGSTGGSRAGKADPRVQAGLAARGLKYSLKKSGIYKLRYRVKGGTRTHTVHVNSKTYRLGTMEIREVWALGLVSNSPFSARIAFGLLQDSYKRKLGAWEVHNISGRHQAVFTAKINANASADELRAAIRIVVNTADEIERKVTGRDRF